MGGDDAGEGENIGRGTRGDPEAVPFLPGEGQLAVLRREGHAGGGLGHAHPDRDLFAAGILPVDGFFLGAGSQEQEPRQS